MRVNYIPSFEYQRQRWKNDLGWTREIAREPASGDGFDWRVSIAEIDHDCPFSAFPGLQRSLVLLEGEGMQLRFADGEIRTLSPPHGRIDFSGERALDCQLLEGPTRDFNLMWRPERICASLHHRPLVGSLVFFPEAVTQWLVYLVSGWAAPKGGNSHSPRAYAGDTLRLHPEPGNSARTILEGAGEVLIARLQSLTPTLPSSP